MGDAREEAMLEAFSRCVALLASTRTQLMVRAVSYTHLTLPTILRV